MRLEWARWTEKKDIELTAPQRARLLEGLRQVAAARRAHLPCECMGIASLRLTRRDGAPAELLLDQISVMLLRQGTLQGTLEMSEAERDELLAGLADVTQTPAPEMPPW